MNVLTRGVKNALRSPLRSGAIVLMFAISIALILSMLVARSSVQAKINEVKATAGTNITIRPAGVMGGMGGGNPLTAAQLTTIEKTANVSSTTLTLTDQMGTTDTNLTSSLELGAFGQRQMRFESSGSSSRTSTDAAPRPVPTPRTTVTGTNNVNSVTSDGGALNITSGQTIDANSGDLTALVGTTLATKNNLAVGSTFTAYGSTVTVSGIYKTDNAFQDSGVIMPLKTLQTLTSQPDVVNTVIATVNSSDNVAGTVATLKSSLGDAADITSEVERAQASVTSLEGISSLALGGVIGAAIAGAAIILLAMIMVVRERRREIGVMKAVGGTDGKVVGQFTIEGLTLTFIGTIIGLILGVMVSGPMTTSLVSSQSNNPSTTSSASTTRRAGGFAGGFQQINTNLTQVTASLTPQVFASALGLTFLIAIIGSAIPAWFTARIRPAEVLRTE
jgi:putative ABC transport system permease protein